MPFLDVSQRSVVGLFNVFIYLRKFVAALTLREKIYNKLWKFRPPRKTKTKARQW